MIKLITWEMDRSHGPVDPAERMKHSMLMCEMVKKHLGGGKMKMWGMNPGSNTGFGISDADEKEILSMIGWYIPHVKFRVESMLDVDEVIATLKAMQPKT
jgi:hypothetical protein